ncbi:MAG: hypothetical protein ABSC95_23040 [Acetobacteraceae bacterium]
MTKIAGKELAGLRPVVALPAGAAAAVKDCRLVAEAIDVLEAGGFLLEATRLLAYALPKREAVWWACMCAAHTAPPDLPEPDRLAREAAELWVRQPNDQNRRAAMRLAEATAYEAPETWCAVAVFWSGDTIAPEDQPKVPPAPHMAGKAISGTIYLAAVRSDPKRQTARLKRFLESGRNIAAGGPGRLPAEAA